MKKFITKWNSVSLVLRIIIGLTVGFLLAIVQIQLSDPIKCVDSDYSYVEIAETNVCVDEASYKKATEAEIKATEGAIKFEEAKAKAKEEEKENNSTSEEIVADFDQELVLKYVTADEETTTDAYTTSGKIASAMKLISILGTLFVGALKAVAPLLVFFLVMEAITKHKAGQKTNMKNIIILYLLGTFLAAVVAVFMSFASPVELTLATAPEGFDAPKGLVGILQDLLLRVVANPIESIATANYIGVLFWAVVIALAVKTVINNENTINVVSTIAQGLGQVVKWVISFAPFGIMGLIFDAISTTGIKAMASYGHLILVLIGSMFIVALVVNPIIAFIMMRKNPYPLVFKCLKDSGITAFFTRSSAANIPVNMELCEELGLEEDTYAISIPLGATINMAGAAITITVLTLAAANTYGIPVTIPQALFLSFLAALSACGASGVAGGSLLLIPLACSLFNIPQDYAMQVVGVGFIVGVIQDSCETALNSSTDVLFTAIADFANKRKK